MIRDVIGDYDKGVQYRRRVCEMCKLTFLTNTGLDGGAPKCQIHEAVVAIKICCNSLSRTNFKVSDIKEPPVKNMKIDHFVTKV